MVEVIIPNESTKKLDLVNSNFSESQSWLNSSGYIADWQAFFDLYRSIPKKKKYSWMSNKFFPLTNSKVETAMAQIMGLLYAANPAFQIRPRERNDELQAKIVQRLLQYQFQEANVQYEMTQFVRNLCIFGTAIGKIIWDVRFTPKIEWTDITRPIINMENGMPVTLPNGQPLQQVMGKKPEMKDHIGYSGPQMINCNLGDIFPDPSSIEIQDGWVIHRTKRSKDYLIKMHENYPDVYNEEVYKIGSVSQELKKSADDIQNGLGRYNNANVTRPDGGEIVELYEWWGMDIDPQDGQLKSRVMTVANGKYLVRNTNNPFFHQKNPFVKGVYIPSVNEFYGIGIPELCEDLQNNLNETINQRNDNISLALNRIILFKKGSTKAENLLSSPGRRIGLDEEIDSSIRFLDTPISTRDSFISTQEIERMMQEVTAVTKLTLGTGGTDMNQTASGMAMLQRASGDRFMAIAKNIENNVFKPVIQFFYELDYQMIDKETVFRIVGEDATEWNQISPDDIQRNYDIVPAGIFTMENKMMKAQKLLQFKQITMEDPTIRKTILNRKIYDALEIGDNADELMRPDAEMNEIMQLAQMMAANMLQQQMGQSQPGKQNKTAMPMTKSPQNSGQFAQGSVMGSNQPPPISPNG